MGDTETPDEVQEPDESQEPEFTPITSQDDLNKIINGRLQREKAKFADYDDVKAKASKYDELEEAKKSEVQREREGREAAERELTELRTRQEIDNLAESVAKDTGVPKHLLTGSTEEEMRAKATELLEWQGASTKPRSPRPNPAQGNGSDNPIGGDWLRNAIQSR